MFPFLVRSVSSSGEIAYALCDPLVDRHLEFVRGRCRASGRARSPPPSGGRCARAARCSLDDGPLHRPIDRVREQEEYAPSADVLPLESDDIVGDPNSPLPWRLEDAPEMSLWNPERAAQNVSLESCDHGTERRIGMRPQAGGRGRGGRASSPSFSVACP
jgi:hypothetical protein